MEQDNNQKQNSTEELAENVLFAVNTGVKVFFWLWSFVIGAIALFMFFSNMLYPAIFMMIPALFCNPSFLQYAFNEAAKEGNRPPSIFLIFFLAFIFFCGSIGLAVYQADSKSEKIIESNQQVETTAKAAFSNASIPNDIIYKIIKDEKKRDIKRSVHVLLNRRVSKEILTLIASNIKQGDPKRYERTFIGYFYKGQTSSAYWATTNFNPNLEVIVIGLPYGEKTHLAKNPTQYSSVEAMINGFHDFSSENGTFKIISKVPLHIQLSPQEVRDALPKVMEEDTNRAIMYGIYRTFIHTSINKITVTGVPQEIVNIKTHKMQYIPKYKRTVTITKPKALELVKGYLNIISLSDLVTDDKWTKDFMRLYYNDRGYPGLDRFVGIKH